MSLLEICPLLIKGPFWFDVPPHARLWSSQDIETLPYSFSCSLEPKKFQWVESGSFWPHPAAVSDAASPCLCRCWLSWWSLWRTGHQLSFISWGPSTLGFSLNPPVVSVMPSFYLPTIACPTFLDTCTRNWRYFLLVEENPHLSTQLVFRFFNYLFPSLGLDIQFVTQFLWLSIHKTKNFFVFFLKERKKKKKSLYS